MIQFFPAVVNLRILCKLDAYYYNDINRA